jgi:hypothetical protein
MLIKFVENGNEIGSDDYTSCPSKGDYIIFNKKEYVSISITHSPNFISVTISERPNNDLSELEVSYK